MIKRLIQAYRKIKEEEKSSQLEKIKNEFLYDPLTLELFANMARDCGRLFELVRPDGFVFRFYKDDVATINPNRPWEEI